MNPLSLAPLTVLPASALEQIEAAAAAGFDSVGLRLRPVMETDADIMADAAMQREIKRRMHSSGLTLLDIEVFRFGPDTDIKAMIPAMEFGAELGARFMLCTSGALGEHGKAEDKRGVDKLAELCETSGRFGIKPMLEFMAFRVMATIEDAARMAQSVAHANIGICVDALHLDRSGGTAQSIRGIAPGLLSYAQLCDAPAARPPEADLPREARYGRLYPGEGGLPLAELVSALPADIPLSLEVPGAYSDLTPLERARRALAGMRLILGA